MNSSASHPPASSTIFASAASIAHPNIALVKYWGKRANTTNCPAVGSISITLDTLHTHTRVAFIRGQTQDIFLLNGSPATPSQATRLSCFLDLVRQSAGLDLGAWVESRNNFPTGAGLASSASGFAALADAASRAAGLTLDPRSRSILARQGSGSAARSIFGGYAEMHLGVRPDGQDDFATALADATHWPLRVVIAVTSTAQKDIGSTEGMERTRLTSPYYATWLQSQSQDLTRARAAIATRDFSALARITEHSCMKMHALAMAAEPPLLYWRPATLAALQTIQQLQQQGLAVTYTMDAGPQVKAVCLAEDADKVAAALQQVPGVQEVLNVGLGGPCRSVPFDAT